MPSSLRFLDRSEDSSDKTGRLRDGRDLSWNVEVLRSDRDRVGRKRDSGCEVLVDSLGSALRWLNPRSSKTGLASTVLSLSELGWYLLRPSLRAGADGANPDDIIWDGGGDSIRSI